MKTHIDDDYENENYEEDLRPRSRLILQELAEQRDEQDSFQHIKSKVSGNAIRGIVVLIGAVLLSAIFLQFLRSNSASADFTENRDSYAPTSLSSDLEVTPTPSNPTRIIVHVAGAVNSPGVYELGFGQRVQHAIELAGGATTDAALNSINLAQPVTDGQQIYVPVVGEEIAQTAVAQSTTNSSGNGLINVNTATATELEELPRVGPATAQKIIEYRDSHGRFTQIEDLLAIPGIGEKTVQNFEGLVTF